MVNNISYLHKVVNKKLNEYNIKSFFKILDGGPTKNGFHLLKNGSPFTLLIVVPDIYSGNINNYVSDFDSIFISNNSYYLDHLWENSRINFFLYKIITESLYKENINNLECLKEVNCINSGFEDITDLILRVDKLQSFS